MQLELCLCTSIYMYGKSEKEGKVGPFVYIIGSKGRDICNAMVYANVEKDQRSTMIRVPLQRYFLC